MLGHKLCQVFGDYFDTWVTLRSPDPLLVQQLGLPDLDRAILGVDVFDNQTIEQVVATVRPDVVVNAIGIIKQRPVAQDPIASITVNSLFPHRLAALCSSCGSRLIHISTDCVFSGHRGMYREDDTPDPADLYGRSKLLGEITEASALTIRTSVIGRELSDSYGLVEWVLGRSGEHVKGFTAAIYSGFPTLVLSRILVDIITNHPALSGLYHVSSDPISKYELLCLLKAGYGIPTEIEPSDRVRLDRSLDSSKFRSETGFRPQTWEMMVQAMVSDPTPYKDWRTTRAS